MKILHVGQMIGGLDVYIRNSIEYNTDKDFDFVIAVGAEDKHEPVMRKNVIIKEYSISLYRSLNPFKDLKGLWQVICIVRKEKPDIIHCHSAKGGMFGRIAGWITGTRTFYTPHAFSFLSTRNKTKKKIFLFLERFTKFNTYLLACSESERLLGLDEVGYDEEYALVWNNAVPDASKLISQQADEEDYVAYIGRPSYQKNTLFFVDVIKCIHEELPSVKFKLLGVGFFSPDLEELKTQISHYNLDDIIELVPWLDHKTTLEIVSKSKLYLTCSLYEGLPLAVIEAMSLSKAIIASDVTGNRDCVDDGVNGYLLPLDVDTFVAKVTSLLKNAGLRKDMEIRSRQLFVEKFFIECRINELVNIYLMAGGGKDKN